MLLLLLVGADSLRAEGAWPSAPPPPDVGRAVELEGSAAADYRYAAALYRALAAELERGNPELLSRSRAACLARALLVQGQGKQALDLLGGRDDLPPELALQLNMSASSEDWSDLERERWLGLFEGQDGESLYWRGRLSLMLQERDAARKAFEELLRREPGSVFAPPALEALRELSVVSRHDFMDENEPSRKEGTNPAPGVRVQWGVYRDGRGALRQRDALRAYGQAAEILSFTRDGTELFRVCSPVQDGEDEARRLGESLARNYGLDFVLLRQPAGGNPP